MRLYKREWLLRLGAGLLALYISAPAGARAEPKPSGRVEHADHAEEHRVSWGEVNWYYGMLRERPGVAPSLLWRPPGMPVPVAALALNSVLLLGSLYLLSRRRIAAALVERKATILRDMEEAANMRRYAESRLEEYETKLFRLDEEVERVRHEMREAAEIERAQILREAEERRDRMHRDALLLIEQELRAAREALYREAARGAVQSAEALLLKQMTIADQQRLSRDFLAALGPAIQSLEIAP
ncbi:MAG TPA: ATP synthase F0 subunit B [Polyangiaceae bacterium]